MLRGVHATGRLSAGALFVASYLAVWTLVGVAVYPLYRPHGTLVAGSLAIAAGTYELTPLKRYFRRHCREGMHSGFQFGLSCVGSSIGLMLMFVALGVMSVSWMSVIAIIVLAQKLLPSHLGMLQLDLSDPEFRVHAAAHTRAVDAALQELITDAVAKGELPSCTDVPRLARAVKITTDGSLLRWALTGDGDPAALLHDDLDHLLGRTP